MASSAAGSDDHIEYYARFSDGKSAGARDATVTLGLSGLEIVQASPHVREVWSYANLRSGEPLRERAVDALLRSTASAGASLFVPGQPFAAALMMRAPHLTARAERWRHARPWIGLAVVIAATGAAVYVSGWSPARAIATGLPDSWRQRLGQQAITSMTEGYKKCVDPRGLDALRSLNDRLADATGTGRPFTIVVYDWPLTNAFAVPGDQIVMTQGLLAKAESADEVAGVLAHEMGHGIELHPETGIIRAVGLAAAVELMMGGSSGGLANIGLILAQLGSTRTAEREADLQALRVLRQAQISPAGLGNFFKRMLALEKKDDMPSQLKQFDILSTHPPTEERRALVERQEPYAATSALSKAAWNDLKGICAITVEADPVRTPADPRQPAP
ncbi:MAG: M48 family metallopeptidase [Hyphomicrobium sp.]|nr:M48 family metallopeptidase [Hyphomicrobium sp.]